MKRYHKDVYFPVFLDLDGFLKNLPQLTYSKHFLQQLGKKGRTENAQNKNKIKGLNKENDKLREKIESAKNYLDLDENEKEIIDTKIDEVNKATEDQLAQKKQEQEEAKRVKAGLSHRLL